ncbi:MAG: DUF3810 domain-containing protein [Bacteroidota bacterium]
MINKTNKNIWIILGLSAVGIRLLVGENSNFIEQYYARGLFVYIRKGLDSINSIIFFFPVLYILLLAVFVQIVRGFIRIFKKKTDWKKVLHSIVAFLSATIFLFLLLWGFNYARLPLEQQIQLNVQPLELEDLKTALYKAKEQSIEARQIVRADSLPINDNDLPPHLKEELQNDLRIVLHNFGYPTNFEVKAQQLFPKGILLRFSTLGVYFPWTGECNVDAGLHPLELPFVLAHELAHGYGITDEGTCNFLAYLTCIRSSNPLVQYAGHFEYFTTLAYNYRRYQPDAIKELFKALSADVRSDWTAILENHRHYPNLMPRLRRATYDAYLRVQGIEEGIQNYNRVLMLIQAYEQKISK